MKLFYGNSIKIYRRQHKLSQEELANQLQISKSMLGMLENNNRNASEEIEHRIKKMIGISLDKELQQILLNKFEEYLVEYFENYKAKHGLNGLTQFLNSCIQEFFKIPKLYYGRLMEKDFFEIDNLMSFKNILLYEETKDYYNKNDELKLFYKTYTSFILDNVENIIEVLNNYLAREKETKNIIVFKDKLPLNIKKDFKKIVKSINSTSYADYNTFTMNVAPFETQIGFVITNDSMSPRYEINNIAIVNITDEIENNKDYLIRINKEFLIRRIQIDNEQLLFKPLNFNYDIHICTKDKMKQFDIEVIGKVTDIKIN